MRFGKDASREEQTSQSTFGKIGFPFYQYMASPETSPVLLALPSLAPPLALEVVVPPQIQTRFRLPLFARFCHTD